jgi:putative redox protein
MMTRHEQETGGTGPGHRSISMRRSGTGTYIVTNARGGEISIGSGENDDFTPVELFLTSIAGCSAVDVDFITSRIAEPTHFTVTASGEKLRDEHGNHMGDIEVTFSVRFPRGADGDRARERLPRAIEQSHDRLCTVSRSVQIGTPIHIRES